MAADPGNMRPIEVVGVLNATGQGAVLDKERLRQERTRAGARIGDGKHIDLLRYIAYLFDEAHRQHEESSPEEEYARLKARSAARSKAASEAGRDIGDLPEINNKERRGAAKADFRIFCETYFPQTFHLAWSPDHLKVIAKIEQAVLHGGLFAMAMPRGSGKTSLGECACLWAVLYGHRSFVCLIGAAEPHAVEMLDSIKAELERSDLLLADFPEACYPIRALGGIATRSGGQLFQGQRTHIGWTGPEVILPTIPGSQASAAILKVAGLTGRIRGMKHKRTDGATARPSLVILDDPQTDESARSVSQCISRERIIAGAVLGLAGPGKKIAGVMPCTVIRPGDMADRLLDDEKHPDWNGERTKMVYSFPTNEKIWQKYAEIRADCLRAGGTIKDATAFYREHRTGMDRGARVAWAERFNEDELSAIQHAMNLRLRDEAAFWAEYQNEPLPEVGAEDDETLDADQIVAKMNGYRRRLSPLGVEQVTAFIDVQGKLLFWLVAGWAEDCTGYVIDYGAYPDQGRREFTLRAATKTLQRVAKGAGLEGAIYAGLEKLCAALLGREWKREDGAQMRIERCLVDANWGRSTDLVYQFCRQSAHAAALTPSHGRYVGAGSIPFSEYKRKRGDRVGLNWRIPNVRGKRAIRHVIFDANFWKSFVHARLAVAMGDKGCLSLFGRDPAVHRLLAEHLTAEYRVRTEGRGRIVDEWKARPERPENHWLDCLVGAAVAASMQGVALPSIGKAAAPKPVRVKLSELQRSKR